MHNAMLTTQYATRSKDLEHGAGKPFRQGPVRAHGLVDLALKKVQPGTEHVHDRLQPQRRPAPGPGAHAGDREDADGDTATRLTATADGDDVDDDDDARCHDDHDDSVG